MIPRYSSVGLSRIVKVFHDICMFYCVCLCKYVFNSMGPHQNYLKNTALETNSHHFWEAERIDQEEEEEQERRHLGAH